MNPLFSYVIQSIAVSGILYGYYYLALRNRKFHQYNRYYLLAIPVLSILIPLLNIPVYFSGEQVDNSPLLQTLTVTTFTANEDITISSVAPGKVPWYAGPVLLKGIYLLVLTLLMLRLFVSLLKIFLLIKKYPAEKMNEVRFMNTNEPGTPFSFFSWLFWNKNTSLVSEKGGQMFRHELFHIQQKHSADIIYAEIVAAIFWFNPFFHLTKKELRAIHEFLADQFAVTENTKWQYAELLLMQALQTNQRLVNPFFHNQIKRRIAMITQSSKPGHQYLKKLMVLPLTAVAAGLFAFSYHRIQEHAAKADSFSTTGIVAPDTTKPGKQTIDKIYVKPDQLASFPGGSENWKVYLMRSLNPSVVLKNKAPEGSYTVIVMFIVDKDGTISATRALTKHGYGMEQEALRVITSGPKWEPALVAGKQVKSYFKQPITFISGSGNSVKKNAIIPDDNMLGEVVTVAFPEEPKASFPGGPEKWKEYLIKNIRPLVPVDSGAPAGTYKTIIQFLVQADGSLTDFKSITHNGYGMEQEVIRMLSTGPNWTPPTVNGKKIKSYVQQPVTFQVAEEDKPITNSDNKHLGPNIPVAVIKKASVPDLLQLSANSQVISFTFTTDMPNGEIAEASVAGSNWTAPAKNLINSLVAGRLVTLDQIRILQNGKEVKLPGKVYYVVD